MPRREGCLVCASAVPFLVITKFLVITLVKIIKYSRLLRCFYIISIYLLATKTSLCAL